MEPGTDWKQSLARAIESVELEGGFACSGGECEGDVTKPLPELSVTGIGTLALPLQTHQATALLAAGQPAPYGRGSDTVLDTTVRRATQLDATCVRINAAWETTLQDITAEVASALGVDAIADVEARLYKLLLYTPGGHFVSHRDTEKEPGMFATLVVQLPVQGGHSGGTLRVKHLGQVFEWDTAAVSRTDHLAYAAFYADCEHELTAVTAGLRVVLVYNLVRTAPGSPLQAPGGGRSARLEALGAAVRSWESAPGAMPLLVLPLEHKYTEANLSMSRLKGRDVAVAKLLGGCELLDVHLALVTKEVTGSVEVDSAEIKRYDYWQERLEERRRRRRYASYAKRDEDEDEDEDEGEDEDEMESDWDPSNDGQDAEMIDVDWTNIRPKKWVSLAGAEVDLDCLDVHLEDCLLNGKCLFGEGDMDPDEREYKGFMGNEGPTLKFFYHRAVAVIWPRSRRVSLACAAGFKAAICLLERQMEKLMQQQPSQQQQLLAVAAEEKENEGEEGTGGKGRMQEDELQKCKQLLQAVMDMAEKDPIYAFRGYATDAFKVVAMAPSVLGAAAAAVSANRFIAVLAASEGLADLSVVIALAAAAASVPDPAFHDSIVAMVPRFFSSQLERFAQLAKEPSTPEALRSRVAAALMEAALAPSGFTRLQQSDVLAVARLVCEGGPQFQQHQADFVKAVMARNDRQVLLQALMREPCIARGAAAGVAAVMELVRERLKVLEEVVAKGPPEFSWEQPHAVLPDYPEVQAFLRGPDQMATFRGIFRSFYDPRDWANKYFRHKKASECGYSATAVPEGQFSRASCTVTKTTQVYRQIKKQYDRDKRELAEVRMLAAAAIQSCSQQVPMGAIPPGAVAAGPSARGLGMGTFAVGPGLVTVATRLSYQRRGCFRPPYLRLLAASRPPVAPIRKTVK